MSAIDINADLGEGGPCDDELLQIVSSCNIACGGHAGDTASMHATVGNAIANRVAVGAHPSYPDREGFGRRSRFLTDARLPESLLEQITQLSDIVVAKGTTLHHVKPHGALYNDCTRDSELATMFVAAVQEAVPHAAIVGMPDSALAMAAATLEQPYIREAFIDRAYENDGRLVSRSEPGAVLEDLAQIVAQSSLLALSGEAETQSGRRIRVVADTLCVHGDTPGAAQIARAVRHALQQQGVEFRAIGRR